MFNYETIETEKPYIIAEIGANHNGEMNLAIQMIDAAKHAGADCVKFQSWSKDTLFSRSVYNANDGLETVVEKYSLNSEQHRILKDYCDKIGIDFCSTPFSKRESDLLVDELNVPFIKVASMDLNNLPFLQYLAKKGKPIVLSTGLGSLADVDNAITCLEKNGCNRIILLHCVAIYPPNDEQVFLNNIDMLRETFGYPVGYSDHTLGTVAPILSFAKKACVLEKHFTLDKEMEGWDHKVSADEKDMLQIVEAAERSFYMMGSLRKKIVESAEQRNAFKRSIVAAKEIKKGEVFRESDLDFKRPGTGIEPQYFNFIVGKKATRDIQKDEIIKMEDF